MAEMATFERLLELANLLSAVDKIRLIEHLAPQIEHELKSCNPSKRRPLLGIWRGLGLSEKDIDHARHEMRAEIPREDV